jgi:hypothetical protein
LSGGVIQGGLQGSGFGSRLKGWGLGCRVVMNAGDNVKQKGEHMHTPLQIIWHEDLGEANVPAFIPRF